MGCTFDCSRPLYTKKYFFLPKVSVVYMNAILKQIFVLRFSMMQSMEEVVIKG